MSEPTFDADTDLSGWTIIALRDASQNARIGRLVRARGGRFIGLPALRLQAAADTVAATAALGRALACAACIFTSPAAVRHAAALRSLGPGIAGQALAVGQATASALRRAGVASPLSPAGGMHSEALLALPLLLDPPACVGLVTAPGGRELLSTRLAERGADVVRADVYRRAAGRIDRRHTAAVLAADGRLATLLSSAEALGFALDRLSPSASARLLAGSAIASSARLATFAQQTGFATVIPADSPRPADLLAALPRNANADAIR